VRSRLSGIDAKRRVILIAPDRGRRPMVNDRNGASFAPCPRSREASEAAEESAGALLDGLPRGWYAECWSSHPARTSTGMGIGNVAGGPPASARHPQRHRT